VFESVLQSPSLPKHYIARTFGEPAICNVFLFVAQHPYSKSGLLTVGLEIAFRHTPLDEGSARPSAMSFKGYSV